MEKRMVESPHFQRFLRGNSELIKSSFRYACARRAKQVWPLDCMMAVCNPDTQAVRGYNFLKAKGVDPREYHDRLFATLPPKIQESFEIPSKPAFKEYLPKATYSRVLRMAIGAADNYSQKRGPRSSPIVTSEDLVRGLLCPKLCDEVPARVLCEYFKEDYLFLRTLFEL